MTTEAKLTCEVWAKGTWRTPPMRLEWLNLSRLPQKGDYVTLDIPDKNEQFFDAYKAKRTFKVRKVVYENGAWRAYINRCDALKICNAVLSEAGA